MFSDNITEEVKSKLHGKNTSREEGGLAKAIESQTSKIPSDAFLWSAVGIMGVSLTLKILKKNSFALFVGQWAAPILLMGLYNKLVKLEGHDQVNDRAA